MLSRFLRWLFHPGPERILLAALLEEIRKMNQLIEELRQEIAAERDVVASAILLLDGLLKRLIEIGTDDPQALKAFIAEVRGQRTALAEAVARDTPPEEPPAPRDFFAEGAQAHRDGAERTEPEDVVAAGVEAVVAWLAGWDSVVEEPVPEPEPEPEPTGRRKR